VQEKNNMNKNLLFAGGLLNGLFTLFHLFLGWQIQGLTSLPPAQQAMMQELNMGSLLMLVLVTCASLFCASDLLTTWLGKTTLVIIALFYGARAAAEILIAPRFSPLIFGACLLVALLYLLIIFSIRKTNVA
jgi:hypothetical protein